MKFVIARDVRAELADGVLAALARMLGADRIDVCDGGGTVLERWSDGVDGADPAAPGRDDLFDALSHDLRTPLTSVLGFAATLHSRGASLPPTVVAEACAQIEHAALQMSSLLDDLGTYARGAPDSRRGSASCELVAVIRRVAGQLGVDGIKLEADGPFSVLVDGAGAELIIEHLLRNVERHAPRDRRVVVGVCQIAGAARMTIEDDGPGFPAGLESRVFEPLVRADPESRTGEGSGMGLAIVQRLVELHGGRVSAGRSQRLGGACIEVELPLADGQ